MDGGDSDADFVGDGSLAQIVISLGDRANSCYSLLTHPVAYTAQQGVRYFFASFE
jgi:hypothetical protein